MQEVCLGSPQRSVHKQLAENASFEFLLQMHTKELILFFFLMNSFCLIGSSSPWYEIYKIFKEFSV